MLSVQFSMQSIYVCVVIIITTNNKKHIQLHATLYKHTNRNTRYKKHLTKKAPEYDEYISMFLVLDTTSTVFYWH